jgi:hypothetical protein
LKDEKRVKAANAGSYGTGPALAQRFFQGGTGLQKYYPAPAPL